MTSKGLTTLPIFLITGAILLATAGIFISTQKTSPKKATFHVTKVQKPATTPSPTPTPTKTANLGTYQQPTATTGTISIHITDAGTGKAPANANNFKLNIYSLPLNFRKENQNTSDWTLTGLVPGAYKIEIFHANSNGFPDWREKTASCDGCTNAKATSDFTRTSFDLDLKAGDTATLNAIYSWEPAGPPIGSSQNQNHTDDHQAPTMHVFYPGQNGQITYKTDGKICAYESAPTDSAGDTITTYFAFDGDAFQSGVGYLCKEVLPNGSHTLKYYAVDNWGNVEETKTLNFTVNIPGN